MNDSELGLQFYKSWALPAKTLATIPFTQPGPLQGQLRVSAQLHFETVRDGQLTSVELAPSMQALVEMIGSGVESSFKWIADNPWKALGFAGVVIFVITQLPKNY